MMEKMKISCTWLFFLVFDDDLPISDVFCSHCRRDCSRITLCTMKHTEDVSAGSTSDSRADWNYSSSKTLYAHTQKYKQQQQQNSYNTAKVLNHPSFFSYFTSDESDFHVMFSSAIEQCFSRLFLRSFKVFLWAMAAIFPHPFQSTQRSWPFPEYIFLIQV